MKRAVIIFAILVVLLVGGAFIAPSFVDWNKYKSQIIEQVEVATGYDVEIGGSLEMAVLPYPHVAIGNLTVAAGAQPLAKLDQASVQLALGPLFSGNVEVSKIQLVNPDFQVSIAADGTPSWMTPELQARMGKKQGGGSEIANAIALNAISVKNGAFSFKDQRSGQVISLKDINLTVQGESLYGPYSVDGGVNYQGQDLKIKLNSGRIDKLAESIAAQLELGFPALASTVSYSGVVAYKDHLELQGETGVDTQNLAALMKVFVKDAPAQLAKPFSSKGILTLTDKEAAYRNLKIGFAGVNGNGYVVVKNFTKDAKGPLNLEVTLEAAQPVVLDKLVPESKGEKKTKAPFLPETFTAPRELSGSINLKAPELSFKGKSYKDVAFNIDSREKGFGGQLNLKGPGSTTLDINSMLQFAAQSKSAQNGAVTYSDPVLALETKLASAEPMKLVEAFLKQPADQKLMNLLANNLASEAKVSVKPKQVDISASFVKLGETRINASGAYKAGGARDHLRLAVNNFGLDVDYWVKKINGPTNAAVAQPAAAKDIRDVTRNFSLPFDIDFSADIQSLHLKGRDYSKLGVKGRLIGKQLAFDSLQLVSNGGDEVALAGSVKDIQALSGIDLSLNAGIVDLEQTLASFGLKNAKLPSGIGKSELIAEVKGEPDKLSFTANLNAMRGTMAVSGALADAVSAPKLSDLTLRLQHPSYVDLVRLYQPSFSGGVAIKKNLDVFASMSRKDNVYTFSQLQAVIGPANIKGDVVADVSGAKPAITAALEATDLPVDDLLGIQTGGNKTQPARQVQDVRWSRNAINTEFLHKANIVLKATANSLSYGNWTFKNAGINLELKDGVLDIRQMDGGLYGGHAALTGTLKSSDKPRQPISFAGKILAQDVSMEEFVKSFSGSRLVTAKGPVSLNADIATSGLSPAALVFDLSGKGTASGTDLTFEGFDLARLSRALAEPSSSFTQNFTRLLDASLKGGTTHFKTLDGAYTITEGVIHLDKMDLTGEAATVATAGTISLPLWSVDLESTVNLAEPEDAPPLRASFKGPLDKPAQTFGQNAMQQYFQQQLEGLVLNPLLETLEKKGVVPGGLLGGPKQQPQPAPVQTETQDGAPAGDAGANNVSPVPQQQQPAQKEITPEDAMFGIIQGIIKDSGQ